MTYIPKNKVINNLYTAGDNFYVKNTSEDYSGNYYKTSNGTFFSGQNPSDPTSVEIIPYSETGSNPMQFNDQFDNNLSFDPTDLLPLLDPKNEFTSEQDEAIIKLYELQALPYTLLNQTNDPRIPSTIPVSTVVLPTEKDTNLGIFDRYFIYRYNWKQVLEITKKEFNNIKNKDEYLRGIFLPFIISWTIGGKEEEAFNTNLNATKITQQRLNIEDSALVRFFSNNFAQYHTKITSDLYTSGGEFTVRATGEEYVGFYHIHPDKGPMVGGKHVSYPHDFLDPINGIPDQTESIITPPTSQTPTYTPPSSPTPPPTTGGGFSGGGGY